MKSTLKLIGVTITLAMLALTHGCSGDSKKTNNPGSQVVVNRFYPTVGGVGTEIIITGKNFSEDPSEIEVTLSGRKLPVVGSDMNNIVVVVPRKLGSGQLDVKIGVHDPVSTVDEFTYVYTANVITFAGNGEADYADGYGTDAMFCFDDYSIGEGWRHGSLATDSEGNVYVSDAGNKVIRKITPEGEVTTLAGRAGSGGSVDGTGAGARVDAAYGMARDVDGNIVFTDTFGKNIRKVTPSGVVTTLGPTGFEPWFIGVDKNTGYYYIVCKGDGIYEWKSASDINKIIDYGGVNGIVLDDDGNIYTSDHLTHKIVKYDAGTWNRTEVAGSGVRGLENGSFSSAKFAEPAALAIDANGDIFVAGNGTWDGSDNDDQSIRRLDMTMREVVNVAGSSVKGFVDGNGAAAAFDGAQYLTIDDEGIIYIYDKMNNAVRKIIYE